MFFIVASIEEVMPIFIVIESFKSIDGTFILPSDKTVKETVLIKSVPSIEAVIIEDPSSNPNTSTIRPLYLGDNLAFEVSSIDQMTSPSTSGFLATLIFTVFPTSTSTEYLFKAKESSSVFDESEGLV